MTAAQLCPLSFIAAAAALAAQQTPDAATRLERAREVLRERDQHLPNYTCLQTLERTYFKPKHKHAAAPCAPGRSPGPDDFQPFGADRLRLDLKVSQGQEIGTWAGSQFDSRSIFDLAGGGPYGTGMLGALISDTFLRSGAVYHYIGEKTLDRSNASEYSYQVPAAASHYQVRSGNTWTSVAFSGPFWLDPVSVELKRLTAQTHGMPPESGACDSSTTVDYQQLTAGSGAYLLPQTSTTRILMRDGTETQMTAVYSGCREYRGEATIRYDETPAPGVTKTPSASAPSFPAGLDFSIALTDPIDTDTAAAGDLVHAKLVKPVRDRKTKAVLAPSGAAVEVRIVQMQHWLKDPPRFSISLALEKVQTDGAWRPLYAQAQRKATNSDVDEGALLSDPSLNQNMIVIAPHGQPAQLGAFVFRTDRGRYRVPAGYSSDWITIEPTPEASK